MRAVCEVAQSIVDPHAVGLVVVCDPCIEIAIAIEVTEGDAAAIGVAEGLTVVCEVACGSSLIAPLVDPHEVRSAVCDPCIEIAIAIEVTEGDTVAIGFETMPLATPTRM